MSIAPRREVGIKVATSNQLAPGANAQRAREDRAIYRALTILERRAAQPGIAMTNTATARDWFRLKLGDLPHEEFAVAWLDNKHRVLSFEVLSRGTIDQTAVYPREVVRAAIARNAAAAIFAHNHPSGDVSPSFADRSITDELRAALSLVGVKLLDHIIVSAVHTHSLADDELMNRSAPIARVKPIPRKAAKVRRVTQ